MNDHKEILKKKQFMDLAMQNLIKKNLTEEEYFMFKFNFLSTKYSEIAKSFNKLLEDKCVQKKIFKY